MWANTVAGKVRRERRVGREACKKDWHFQSGQVILPEDQVVVFLCHQLAVNERHVQWMAQPWELLDCMPWRPVNEDEKGGGDGLCGNHDGREEVQKQTLFQ